MAPTIKLSRPSEPHGDARQPRTMAPVAGSGGIRRAATSPRRRLLDVADRAGLVEIACLAKEFGLDVANRSPSSVATGRRALHMPRIRLAELQYAAARPLVRTRSPHRVSEHGGD